VSESPRRSGASTWVKRNILFETGEEFLEDRALRLGAGLAYHGVVTAAPLLVLLIGLAGLIVGEEARTGELARSLTGGVGRRIRQRQDRGADNDERARTSQASAGEASSSSSDDSSSTTIWIVVILGAIAIALIVWAVGRGRTQTTTVTSPPATPESPPPPPVDEANQSDTT
jgi:hypothetical protein